MFFYVGVVVRSSSSTSLSEISKLMNMDSMFSVGLQSFDRECDFGGGIDTVLAERSDASHVGLVGVENTDSVSFGIWSNVVV
jgi:hypothetical protein